MTSTTYSHDKLPETVIKLLQNGKFVHLGTADITGIPDVALMNYYYLPAHELYTLRDANGPEEDAVNNTHIILSTPITSVKYQNISQNPNVSLLFHDWTTAKALYKPDLNSNLLSLLHSLNQTELSQVSATLRGKTKIVDDEKELAYYKDLLKKENPDAKVYIDGDENSIILVQITHAKVCDTQNHVSSYD
jgi:hypothetical protein